MTQPHDIELAPGTLLHRRYRIEYTLSKGGFGNVYLATDTKTSRKVAIKGAYFTDEHTREQFAVEARVLVTHSLKGVVHGDEMFEEGGRLYLVMDYVAGMNLEELQIAHFKQFRRPLPENMVLVLMALICMATQELHNLRVVHRDIKPANIKIDPSGQPILLDLGLAKLDPATNTLLAAQAYTPGYAPPEQCREGGSTDERTDVYALGATTYYSLTGRQPWDAILRLTELQQGHGDMPTPRDHAPWISPQTDAVVMQALDLNADHRFATPAAMQRALEDAYRALGDVRLCQVCHTLNAPDAEFCADCGAALQQHPQPPSPQSVINAAVPANEPPTLILPPKPAQAPAGGKLILQPEPMQTPRPLLPRKPRMSWLATMALVLSVIALVIPVLGQLLALVVVLPMGLIARGNIAHSNATVRGMGRAMTAVMLALLNVIGAVLLVYLVATGKIHPFG